MMIAVGLAGWGEHQSLYSSASSAKDKLRTYSEHFSIVEMDSSFYAIQPPERMAKYAEQTPADFRFVVKAYQGMTGHLRGRPYYDTDDKMFQAFRESLDPIMKSGKLSAALFQYPPWFDCTKNNVRLLRETKRRMEGFPCALEFRHQSWFTPEYMDKSLEFMQEEGWIHSVCDEPQAGAGSIPIVLRATQTGFTLVRMHGRNVSGWNQSSAPNWREVRYLYDYNEEELTEWKERILLLCKQSSSVGIIFNNNSGGHAAANAKQLMRMLGMPVKPDEPAGDVPMQLDLFNL